MYLLIAREDQAKGTRRLEYEGTQSRPLCFVGTLLSPFKPQGALFLIPRLLLGLGKVELLDFLKIA